MFKGTRPRVLAAILTALALGTGSAVWATSSASAAPGAHAASVIRECTSADLVVWVSPDLGNGALGTIYYPLDFTNISNRTCFLVGWPGVSAINFTLRQLGSAAVRDTTVPRRFVNLAPGATAHATLRYIDAQVDRSPGCRDTNATFLKVFPPDQRSARIAFFDNPVCTVKGRIYLRIERIQPGVV